MMVTFSRRGAGWLVLGIAFLISCGQETPVEPVVIQKSDDPAYCRNGGTGVNIDVYQKPCEKLSAYRLFKGDGSAQEPNDGVIQYELITPLYSDYTHKRRYIYVPEGSAATYSADDVFDFPVGTVIVKTFSYLKDIRNQSAGEDLLETRLLIHRPEGWVGLPYVWNEDESDAVLKVEGDTMPVSWIHYDGSTKGFNYSVPDGNDCKGCHKQTDGMKPIGPKSRNLNTDFTYPDGKENQLARMVRLGALSGMPSASAVTEAVPVWDDPSSGSLHNRARAYLDNNCAHCHNPKGPARNSGLDLAYTQVDLYATGICKAPVAAGGGSGGLSYDIVPGSPDESILVFRMASSEADVKMPEIARALPHTEGVELMREWITAMEPVTCGTSK